MAVESITKTLGAGSGVDLTSMVDSLVDAQFASKTKLFDKREEALKSQISSASELKNAISGFSSALLALSRGGTLSTQPTSGDPSVVRASLISGGSAANLSASIEVRQLAQAQATHSALIADPTAAIGAGKLMLNFGTATVADGAMTGFTGTGDPIEIDITKPDANLNDVAAAINAKGAGITASVLSDVNGARLVLKGATGEAKAFELTATEGAAGLAALNVGRGAPATIGTAAQDAVVAVDGVRVQRATNGIEDIVPGVRLDLVGAKPGSLVQLGSQLPTTNLSNAVEDVVTTYNELMAMLNTATDPQTGALRTDPAARSLKMQLSRLVSTAFSNSETGPRTLAEIGVSTNRDGTLTLDSTRLSTALSSNASSVESMFRLVGGLPSALSTISIAASSRTSGLGASETRYTAQQKTLTDDRDKATAAAEAMRTRMTQQFASMDAKVASYKSTQSFLEQQVKAWNSSN